jgi:hypothetical protein
MASESRFCVLWIKNTIKNVIMVVPVLITSCQVSLNPNSGPVTAHNTIISTAAKKVIGLPLKRAVRFVNRVNHDLDFVGLMSLLLELHPLGLTCPNQTAVTGVAIAGTTLWLYALTISSFGRLSPLKALLVARLR